MRVGWSHRRQQSPVPPCYPPLLDKPSGSRTPEMPGGVTQTPGDPHLYATGSADGSGREKREERQLPRGRGDSCPGLHIPSTAARPAGPRLPLGSWLLQHFTSILLSNFTFPSLSSTSEPLLTLLAPSQDVPRPPCWGVSTSQQRVPSSQRGLGRGAQL